MRERCQGVHCCALLMKHPPRLQPEEPTAAAITTPMPPPQVREFATATVYDGTAVSTKYARAQKLTYIEQQKKYREAAQRVFDKQVGMFLCGSVSVGVVMVGGWVVWGGARTGGCVGAQGL